jgi:hypothetical protein
MHTVSHSVLATRASHRRYARSRRHDSTAQHFIAHLSQCIDELLLPSGALYQLQAILLDVLRTVKPVRTRHPHTHSQTSDLSPFPLPELRRADGNHRPIQALGGLASLCSRPATTTFAAAACNCPSTRLAPY